MGDTSVDKDVERGMTVGDPCEENIHIDDDCTQHDKRQYLREMKSIRNKGGGQRMGE